MPDLAKTLLGFALLPLVAACAAPGAPAPRTGQPSVPRTSGPPPRTTPIPPSEPRPSVPGAFIAPKVMNDPALSFVIGSRASQLEQTFGPPRLDVLEGDARKLQFAGEQCVLDVFLYPLSPGAEPTATYVDARRASDALDVDRGACAKALRR
ncbi:hypothetical protein AAJ72_13790 [Citromicrobium sp. RCC1885]|uniref:hypothetical protein n=1 Tax=unclassified Citromicrobium TaxID=2630544 RepID=UPI0006C920B8|nr:MULTISPECIES: hypothetical protein [unclassified Citromicrobium]KPM21718.1 hypothetical protein AAJ72_13790 [Citromicrobium sp. RCC1885]KPM23652.1 hypothetical protein AAJ74_14835 [Citromicrobium sp. RCC1878]MAO05216.1 hypothetical protein [Citromicrobium sp.]OAM06866.1 hypothetical protein A0U43_14760 [Citromicrobium sp. RCC1897]|tara:strand:- start:272 stop:727 length:456 start_codon:yes stop_codon:yes gene_type:complete